MASTLEDVCLPINLDAFVLNEAVCDSGGSRIAPITMPNYVSLRLQNNLIQHDILPHVDLHNSQPSLANPRISKTFSNPTQFTTIDRSRLGVYLHWTIPRAYRSAASQASSTDPGSAATTKSNPKFPLVPNRWLIVRILRDWTPKTANPDRATAWVIESDRLRKIETLDSSVDIETDVTPFVAYSNDATNNADLLNNQAENYIGLRTTLAAWNGEQKVDRVPLTVMNSSNPVFADYAIHNPNVFSTKDNFQYGTDSFNNPLYLDTATCDYFVAGWHSSMGDDPLGVVANPNAPASIRSRLSHLFCAAPTNSDGKDDKHTTDTQTVSGNNDGGATRLICHAARYSVAFTSGKAAIKPKTPADDYANYFSPNLDMEPVSVGTTPLDAVLAFFQAHKGDDSFESAMFGDDDTVQTAKTLMQIQELLYATEDDYDQRVKAADLIYSHNFQRSGGGFVWHYNKQKGDNEPPAIPSDSEKVVLASLNEYQSAWDAADRKLDQLRWALFSEFFKYVSDPTNDANRMPLYTSRIPLLRNEAIALQAEQATLQGNMDKITGGADPTKAQMPLKKVSNGAFYKRTDPSLCLAGIDAGWDPEFLSGSTPTRFVHQISGPGHGDTSLTKGTLANVLSRLPSDLNDTVSKLLTEASGGYQDALALHGHKIWDRQPFQPQFVEWEGVYYHIADDQWQIALTQTALSDSNHTQVTYINPNDLSKLDAKTGPLSDQRHISGRMLVLPQPIFVLDAVVSQVLGAALPGDLPDDLQTDAQKNALKTGVKKLKFISGQLTGLTDALLTMANGQHVKPNVRPQGQNPIPMTAATRTVAKALSIEDNDFVLMGDQTGRTPYGTLTDFENVNSNPFKGVQHGQFAITKLTIVDKFGQAICYPFPKQTMGRTPRVVDPTATPDFIHPCLSEQLLPSLLSDGKTLNTVYTPAQTHDLATKSGYPMTPFIQLTPAINQEARINLSFVEPQSGHGDPRTTWSIRGDWENPIFGWVIVNYADSSLQFFNGEGIFYTALEYGGPKGIIQSNSFLPFEPPADPGKYIKPQLDALIKQMTAGGEAGRAYFHALWDLIRRAISSMPFPPSDYAQYANAIVGKPLALTNVGLSLELAQPAWWKQSTMPSPLAVPDKATVDPLRTDAMKQLSNYPFPVKMGDADRSFDGVVAYWDATDQRTGDAQNPFGSIYTYFPADKDDGVRKEIAPDNFPRLYPFFTDPAAYTAGTGFIEASIAQMTTKTVLIDPYTPVHVYSGILPIASLQLPAWTMQQAMKNMTAFFTMGPILLTKDVPKLWDSTSPLTPSTWMQAQSNTSTNNSVAPISLPIAGQRGLWQWLQPYAVAPTPPLSPPNNGVSAAAAPVDLTTHYNALEVSNEDGKLRLDPAPYTFVEGFLQLAAPLVNVPSPPKPNDNVAVAGG
ncbi:hypothetical protein GQ53DRAFT_851002 [Thozetella sp. PMI_491]|nr:hypothetical protein GQ53DRAFT_851002 [Thozetella sp. PMI_491]